MATGEAFHRVSKEAKCELCCAKLLKFCCVLCRAGSVIPLTARIMPLGSSLADACISQCARVAHGPKPTLLPACFIDEWPHCKTEIPFHACHFFFFLAFHLSFSPIFRNSSSLTNSTSSYFSDPSLVLASFAAAFARLTLFPTNVTVSYRLTSLDLGSVLLPREKF